MSEIALQLVMRALSSSNIGTNTSLLPTHTGEHLPRHHFSESRSNALPVIAIEVKGEGQPFCTKGRYTSDVLEHKWRASLKTILFLYE